MSVKIQSSCSAKNFGVTSMISVTPVVFWAVKAVMALIAYTPCAIIVLISAWMPAPPLESLPAIVNAVFIIVLLCINFVFKRYYSEASQENELSCRESLRQSDRKWCPRSTACFFFFRGSYPRAREDASFPPQCQGMQKCH